MTIEPTTVLPFFQVDAFADRPFAGNQAAVMPLDAWLPDATLLAIANENNLSETAFIVPRRDGEADYDLRWFTPAVEVALCGHATFASGHIVLGERPDLDRVRFMTRKAGLLEVARDGTDRLSMSLPAYPPTPADSPAFEAGLGVKCEAVLAHSGGYTVGVLPNADAVRALKPDFRALGQLGDILAIATAPGDNGFDVVSRVFAPGAGIDEDPVTGSAHSVLVPYWAKRLGRNSFTAFQASPRGGALHCRLADDRVFLGGRCVTVIEGRFRI